MSKKETKSVQEANSVSLKVVARGYDANGMACFDTFRTTVKDGVEVVEVLSENGDAVRTISMILTASNYLSLTGLFDITPPRKEK